MSSISTKPTPSTLQITTSDGAPPPSRAVRFRAITVDTHAPEGTKERRKLSEVKEQALDRLNEIHRNLTDKSLAPFLTLLADQLTTEEAATQITRQPSDEINIPSRPKGSTSSSGEGTDAPGEGKASSAPAEERTRSATDRVFTPPHSASAPVNPASYWVLGC